MERVATIGQGAGDFGRRMTRALDALPPGPAVLVGGDVPELTSVHVWAAFRALGRADVVFGPAADGGYWLIGRRHRLRPLPPLDGVRWSTRHALADSRARLGAATTTAEAATLADVDDGAGYRAWLRRTKRGTVRP